MNVKLMGFETAMLEVLRYEGHAELAETLRQKWIRDLELLAALWEVAERESPNKLAHEILAAK